MGDIPYDQMARHIGLNSAKVFFPPGRMYGEGREPKFDILRVRELKDAIRFLKLFSPTRFGGLSLGGEQERKIFLLVDFLRAWGGYVRLK
eukprot:367781-Amorphochlora_amoeboformis.AAC.2